MDFVKFNPIPRFSREWRITEKIDGTNAQIAITHLDQGGLDIESMLCMDETTELGMWVGSRFRWVQPGRALDNFGFAAWCLDNAADLFGLGAGRHFGEWWGSGIQRGYGMDERHLTLFREPSHGVIPDCVTGTVPRLRTVLNYSDLGSAVAETLEILNEYGSFVRPGYYNPEGIVLEHVPSGWKAKYTLDGDGHKTASVVA